MHLEAIVRCWMTITGALLLVAPAAGGQVTTAEKKVLLIGLDGVRVDVLDAADTPHIDSLRREGVYSARARNVLPTVSGPNWSSMLTGVTPERHGVRSNDFRGNAYAAFPDFLTRLEQVDSAFATFAVVDWPPLGTTASGGPVISDAIDRKVNLNGDALGYAEADARSVQVAVEVLATEDPDAAFVYLGNIDVVGHETGSLSAAYRESIEQADAYVGALLAALRRRATYDREDWLLLISTDHGRRDDGGHGGESELERTIFVLASGPSAGRGTWDPAPQIADVAVTALAHLGVGIDPAWRLDGRPFGVRR